MVFTKKETAEVIFGKKVTHAVVTVPANFNDDDLTEREIDEIVPVGVSTRIPMDQPHLGGYPGGKNQERKREMGDNMRCLSRGLYTVVTMPRSVHCGDDAAPHFEMSVRCGDAGIPA